jgi:fermentation-respiration switch protein FrsA (DUF1100 family)
MPAPRSRHPDGAADRQTGGMWVRALVVVVTVVVLLLALAWTFQRRLVYLPDTSAVPPASDVLPGARDVVLETDDDLELGGWLVPPTGEPNEFTVLVANGNGGNREGRAPLAEALADAGFEVLLFDYRGYGGNPGSPSEDGLTRDALAAHGYLVETLGRSPQRLVYFGESLGGAVVARLATEHPPAAMLLRSPFTDLAATGQEHYPFLPVGLLLRDELPVRDLVADLDVPVTVVLGTEDSIVPPSQSREVADAAPGLVELVEVTGTDHNDAALVHGPDVVAAVETLVRAARSDGR